MFDISWTEFVLIGVVALIVIGPKELPGVMRTMGQWTRRVRSMAADFQNQFQEAMREAEITDLKKQVDDIAHGIKHYNPLKDVRGDIEAIGKDIETSITDKPASAEVGSTGTAAIASSEPVALSPPEPAPEGGFPLPEVAAGLRGTEVVGAATGPVAPEPVEKTAGGELPSAETPANLREPDAAAAGIGPVVPESAEQAEPADSTRRTA